VAGPEHSQSGTVALKGDIVRQVVQGEPLQFRHVVPSPEFAFGESDPEVEVQEGHTARWVLSML